MITIAHLSDLHFGREQTQVIHNLLASLQEQRPDLVIISGDLTQRARSYEFQQAKIFLDNLPYPYFIIPGNHDLSAHKLIERFFFPWKKWKRYISPQLEPCMENDQCKVVGVNSARRLGLYLDWSRGRINNKQISHVVENFNQTNEKKLRILVAHHPFWLPTVYLRRQLIGGRDKAIEALSQAGVDIILGGHIHIPFMKILRGVIISHAGTTVSDRLIEGQPNSYNIIKGDSKKLTLISFEQENQEFTIRQESKFIKTEKHWHPHPKK